MIEYESYTTQPRNQLDNIRIKIVSSFTSEYQATPMYFGQLENGCDVVLKFPLLEGGAEREFNGLTLANKNSIPSPKAIRLIRRKEIPSDGLVMQKIEGRPLTGAADINHEIQLGMAVRKLHGIEMPSYGSITDEAQQFKSAEEYLRYWLQKTVPYMGSSTSESVKLLNILFAYGRNHIINQSPKLLHRDLEDSNVYIQPDNTISIIDFGWAQGGNPLDDIGVYLYHSIRTDKTPERISAFFSGYFDNNNLSDQEKYDLLFHLMLAAGRTVSFCARMNTDHLDEALTDMKLVTGYITKILENNASFQHNLSFGSK